MSETFSVEKTHNVQRVASSMRENNIMGDLFV